MASSTESFIIPLDQDPHISHRNETMDNSISSPPSCSRSLSPRLSLTLPLWGNSQWMSKVYTLSISETNEHIQLGEAQRKSFVAGEWCALHIGNCYVPLGGALFSSSLIIPNVSSLWTPSSETVTEHTLWRRCLNFKTEVPSSVLSTHSIDTPIQCN